MFFKDARDYQILFLVLFLGLGIVARDWTLRPGSILVVLLSCLVTQWLAVSGVNWRLQKHRDVATKGETQNIETGDNQPESVEDATPVKTAIAVLPSLKSACITALGLCLLLRADSDLTMAFAAALAILSKFLFRVRGKHFFNPANFGIIAVLLLTPDAWVSPGQWGVDWWYAMLFAGTGGLVLKRVGRWDTTAAFLGAYALLEAGRNYWLGWTWDVWLHQLMSGSLLLFALFMITDPRSIPNARISRLIWAGCIALLAFILQHQLFLSTAVFWALFVLSPLSILLDALWAAPQFVWHPPLKQVNQPAIETTTASLPGHFQQPATHP